MQHYASQFGAVWSPLKCCADAVLVLLFVVLTHLCVTALCMLYGIYLVLVVVFLHFVVFVVYAIYAEHFFFCCAVIIVVAICAYIVHAIY